MASMLDNCYTKVLQLEQENDDEVKAELVQDLKKNLDALHGQKEILLRLAHQHAKKSKPENVAEV